MNRYKIVVAYDGTAYHGWQIQPDDITIASVLQDTFKYVFKKSIKIVGASRTDSGVHALGQVATFTTDMSIDLDNLKKAWNYSLPKDVVIRSIFMVNSEFHPQAFVKQKTYLYNIFKRAPLPFISRYGYWPKKQFDLAKLKEVLQVFVGTHDFRSFCTGDEQESTIRTIDFIDVVFIKKFGICQVVVKGKSFLRYMIRRIVGAALDIASSSSRSADELEVALAQKNPAQSLFTAPSSGLILRKIIYNN